MDNEDLAELPALHRLLFIYLWMLADREGRLEDRPKRIAAKALPYDRDADVEEILTALQRFGFIDRYQVDGKAVIQVVAFAKHQSPHVHESESELPAKE
ncbi:Replication protein 15, partial [Achromobacter marplatensis]